MQIARLTAVGRRSGIVAVLVALSIGLSVVSPYFLTVDNLSNVLLQSSINTILAVGMTFVIVTAGIDLSVGSVLALSSVILAVLLRAGLPIAAAVLVGLLSGSLVGWLNGGLVVAARIPPFIATLGMMSAARGLAFVVTGGQSVHLLPEPFLWLGAGRIGPLPVPVAVALLVTAVAHLVMVRTRFGRGITAVGGNEEASRLAGLPVGRLKCLVYVIAGFCVGLGAVLATARLGSGDPNRGIGAELDAIAAVIIGGTSLMGGRATVPGSLGGALIIGVLRNGLNLLNVSSYWQMVVIGSVIVATVYIDRLRRA